MICITFQTHIKFTPIVEFRFGTLNFIIIVCNFQCRVMENFIFHKKMARNVTPDSLIMIMQQKSIISAGAEEGGNMSIFNLGNRKGNQVTAGQPFPNSRAGVGGTDTGTAGEYGGAMQGMPGFSQKDEKYVMDLNTQVRKQAEQFAQRFPGFQVEAEMKNPAFREYIWAKGLSVEEAYLLTHKDEILEQLQQMVAGQNTRARIPENGTGRIYPATTRPNFAEMSDEELDAIAARVQKGERISFD